RETSFSACIVRARHIIQTSKGPASRATREKVSPGTAVSLCGQSVFQAKWRPVRVKKTRQIKNLEPRFDSIETEKALEIFPAFASQIFLADLRDRARDLGLCGVRHFADRQAGVRPHQAEQAQRIFERRRVFPGEQSRQPRQPALQISRGLE